MFDVGLKKLASGGSVVKLIDKGEYKLLVLGSKLFLWGH